MKKIVITSLTAGALATAALGLAGTAVAFPNAGTAADVIDGLKAEGYNVQINGATPVALSKCTPTGVHPTLDASATLEQKQHTLVTVDVSCPTHI